MNTSTLIQIGVAVAALVALSVYVYIRLKALHLDTSAAIKADLIKHVDATLPASLAEQVVKLIGGSGAVVVPAAPAPAPAVSANDAATTVSNSVQAIAAQAAAAATAAIAAHAAGLVSNQATSLANFAASAGTRQDSVATASGGPVNRSGPNLDDHAPHENLIAAKSVYAYSFTGKISANLVWGKTPRDGGLVRNISTWVSATPGGPAIPGTAQEMMYNSGGSTMCNELGPLYFCLKPDGDASPVVLFN
jgi:hypothetical protein